MNEIKTVPVVRDGNGKLLADYSLKEHILKIQEEALELTDELLKSCRLDDNPSKIPVDKFSFRMVIAGEACDLITVVYGVCKSFGITEEMMKEAMLATVEKNRNRGYFEVKENDK